MQADQIVPNQPSKLNMLSAIIIIITIIIIIITIAWMDKIKHGALCSRLGAFRKLFVQNSWHDEAK